MADDAVKMWGEMYSLIKGKIPDTAIWKREIPSGMNLRGSWNKPLVCNTAEAYWAFRNSKIAIGTARLDWWVDFCKKPLGGAEGLSPEEIYRGMPITAAFASAALAKRVQHQAAEAACNWNARAHVTWLALGTATAPGKLVTDHHLDSTNVPHVLIGDGRDICQLPWVAVAGPRGFVRNREKGKPPLFQFTTAVSFSWLLARVAGKNPSRSFEPFGHDLCNAILAFRPDTRLYGFSDQDREALRSFMEDPTDPNRAAKLLSFISGQGLAPSQGYTYIRYKDGSVVVFMHRSYDSSTDPTMICVWYKGGKTAMASADDGLRSSSDPQRAWETETAICCQKLSGGPVLSVLKPLSEEAYRIVSDENGFVSMKTKNGIVQPPASQPSAPDSQQPFNPPKQSENKWNFL